MLFHGAPCSLYQTGAVLIIKMTRECISDGLHEKPFVVTISYRRAFRKKVKVWIEYSTNAIILMRKFARQYGVGNGVEINVQELDENTNPLRPPHV